MREHLTAAARQGVESAVRELEGPPLPAALSHVWGWFIELSRARTVGMAANPITWADMDAWSRLTQARPTPFEVSLIQDLDACLLGVVRENKPRPKTK